MSHNLSSSISFPIDILPKASDIFSSTVCLSPIYLTNPDPGIPPFSNTFFNQKLSNNKQESKRESIVDLGNPIVKKLKPNSGNLPILIPVLKIEDSKFQTNSNFSANNWSLSPTQNLSERHLLGEIIPPFEQDKSKLLNQLSTLTKKKKKPVFKVERKRQENKEEPSVEIPKFSKEKDTKDLSLSKKMDKPKKENSFYTINENGEMEEICIDSIGPVKPPQQQVQPLRLPSFVFSELSFFSIPQFQSNVKKEEESERIKHLDQSHKDKIRSNLLKSQKRQEHNTVKLAQIKVEEEKMSLLNEPRDKSLTSDLSSIIKSEIPEFRGIEVGNTNSVCSTTYENEVTKSNSLQSGELNATIAFQEKIEEKIEKEVVGKSVVLTRKMRLTRSLVKEEIEEEKVAQKTDEEEEEEETEVEVKTRTKKTVTVSKILRNRIIKKKERISEGISKIKTPNAKVNIKGNLKKKTRKKFISPWDILSSRRKNKWQLMKTKGTKFKTETEEPKLITRPNRPSRNTSSHLKTPVGLKHQALVPEFKRGDPGKRPIRKPKLTWSPEYLPEKKLDLYFKKIEEILECELNQQKALKILKESNYEPQQVCKMAESKKREYRKEFDLNSRKRKPNILF